MPIFINFLKEKKSSLGTYIEITLKHSQILYTILLFYIFRVLELENETLSGIYKSIGRCIAIVDDKVQNIFGKQLADYFEYHQIKYKPLVYKGNEVDKEIASVENILVDLKKNGVSRNEPVLIIGGKSPTAVLIVCYIYF